jgi:hypothetical protein
MDTEALSFVLLTCEGRELHRLSPGVPGTPGSDYDRLCRGILFDFQQAYPTAYICRALVGSEIIGSWSLQRELVCD